jgi:hypothetical protein
MKSRSRSTGFGSIIAIVMSILFAFSLAGCGGDSNGASGVTTGERIKMVMAPDDVLFYPGNYKVDIQYDSTALRKADAPKVEAALRAAGIPVKVASPLGDTATFVFAGALTNDVSMSIDWSNVTCVDTAGGKRVFHRCKPVVSVG